MKPSRTQGLPHPSKLLTGMLGLAIGFMLFTTMQYKERITSALRRHGQPESQPEAVGTVDKARRLTATSEKHVQIQAIADPCGEAAILANTELWGNVVVPGYNSQSKKGLSTKTALECCQACTKQKGCNRWVFCHNPAVCESQCWLKRVGDSKQQSQQAKGQSVVWTSGIIPKDYDVDPATLPPVNTTITHLVITTPYGGIKIKLMPDWSQGSVAYVRRLAAMPELCSPSCQFYRAEPGFLLQGSLRAFIPANQETVKGPKIMERGEIGWAGGSSGPDFFIYLGDKPATHFGFSHTVWGVVADKQSLDVVEKMVALPATAAKPGDMHMLTTNIDFSTGAL